MDGIRFTTVDPMAEKKPWLTPYHYSSNNPINRIDLDGMYDIQNIKKGEENKVKTIAVFASNYADDKVIKADYTAAKEAGIPILLIDNKADFADGMKGLGDMGVKPSVYAINSHGSDGYFKIGSDKITKGTDFSTLKAGLEGKTVFIGACKVASGNNGKELIKNFSGQISSTVIASDHLLSAGYKYDGGSGLTNMGIVNGFVGIFGGNSGNGYQISTSGSTATQIYNVTINISGKVSWNSGNKSLYQRAIEKNIQIVPNIDLNNIAFPR